MLFLPCRSYCHRPDKDDMALSAASDGDRNEDGFLLSADADLRSENSLRSGHDSALDRLDDFLSTILEIVRGNDVQARVVDDILALLHVRTFEAHHQRHL